MTQLKAILKVLAGRDLSDAEIQRIIDAFVQTYNPSATTQAEKVHVVFKAIRSYVRSVVTVVDIEKTRRTAEQSIIPIDLGVD